MKKVFLSAIILAVALTTLPGLLAGCGESGVNIRGKVQPSDRYELKHAKLILVPLPADKNEVAEARSARGIDGNLVTIQYVSPHPKVELPENGEFNYHLPSLEPGRYILCLHELGVKGVIKRMGGGPYLSRPLADKDKRHLVLEVGPDKKAGFSVDLGEVIAPEDKRDNFITVTLGEVKVIKP